MKDAFNRELKAGDRVAYVGPSGYRGSRGSLAMGYVHSFTPKGVRVVPTGVTPSSQYGDYAAACREGSPYVRSKFDVVLLQEADNVES